MTRVTRLHDARHARPVSARRTCDSPVQGRLIEMAGVRPGEMVCALIHAAFGRRTSFVDGIATTASPRKRPAVVGVSSDPAPGSGGSRDSGRRCEVSLTCGQARTGPGSLGTRGPPVSSTPALVRPGLRDPRRSRAPRLIRGSTSEGPLRAARFPGRGFRISLERPGPRGMRFPGGVPSGSSKRVRETFWNAPRRRETPSRGDRSLLIRERRFRNRSARPVLENGPGTRTAGSATTAVRISVRRGASAA